MNNKFSRLKGAFLLLVTVLLKPSLSYACGNAMEEDNYGLIVFLVLSPLVFLISAALIGGFNTLVRGRDPYPGMKRLFAILSLGILSFLIVHIFIEPVLEVEQLLLGVFVIYPLILILVFGIFLALIVLPRIPICIAVFDLPVLIPVLRKQRGLDRIRSLVRSIIMNGAWIFAIVFVLFALLMFWVGAEGYWIFPALPGLLVLLSLPIAVWIAIRPQGKVAQVARRFSDIDNEIRLVLQFLNGKDPKPSY